MAMWRMRSCPKCGGDIYIEIDGDDWLDHCLQCGYVRSRMNDSCPQCGLEIKTKEQEEGDIHTCGSCG